MTLNEFNFEMERLKAQFGNVFYSNERLRLIFQDVGRQSADWMRLAVDWFIKNHRQAPLSRDFLDRLEEESTERLSLPPGPGNSFKPTNCRECSGDGYTTQVGEAGYTFLMRCYCSAGERRTKYAYGPRKMDGTKEEFIIPPFHRNPTSLFNDKKVAE